MHEHSKGGMAAEGDERIFFGELHSQQHVYLAKLYCRGITTEIAKKTTFGTLVFTYINFYYLLGNMHIFTVITRQAM